MAVGLSAPATLSAVNGVRLAAASAGLKSDGRPDMVLLALPASAAVAGVFTRNAYCAAPVDICRQHLASGGGDRALLINSGNANAGTGKQGFANASALCKSVADSLGILPSEVLPFSTGVIGEQLPIDAMFAQVPSLVDGLHEDHWIDAAHGIMTTDTIPKGVSATCVVDGKPVTISGISKGSGMIHPNMATMLAFVATDAHVEANALQALLADHADRSFNCITVDGDTSTNDSFIYIAAGTAGNQPLQPLHPDWQAFASAMQAVSTQLAHAIVRDGEGATRFIEIAVSGGASDADCREVGLTVAHSPLVKTAFFAGDPNLGRIMAAIGRSRIENLDMSQVDLVLGQLPVVSQGEPDSRYDEARANEIMAAEDVRVEIRLGTGEGAATVWTTDLSYEYVKINAEYRS
jgi:glutamate N-acetyltransferase/amino-acid N-acetyltransferase